MVWALTRRMGRLPLIFEVRAAVLDEPAAQPEALLAVRVLDDPVEGGVRADNDLSHGSFSFDWRLLGCR
jgi:hypothetical protein